MLLELDCKQGGFERNPEIQITTIKIINVVSWILDLVIPGKRIARYLKIFTGVLFIIASTTLR